MLRKKLFLVNLKAKTTPEKMLPYLAQHLAYMTELSGQGVLFASGPFLGANGAPTRDGVSVFNTATAEQARQLAERDSALRPWAARDRSSRKGCWHRLPYSPTDQNEELGKVVVQFD
jgi:uncharacterized protein YciI